MKSTSKTINIRNHKAVVLFSHSSVGNTFTETICSAIAAGVDLAGANLSGKNLSYIDFSRV